MAIQFKRAERAQVKLKVALAGPSGSGKTDGALSLARQLVGPEGKIALLDTENESASLYSDRYTFDQVTMKAPYTSERYMEVIDAAVVAGYDALVIDSISHQWEGEGGILDRKEQMDARGGNQWANWKPFQAEMTRFREKMLQAPLHIVVTLRSKVEYIQVEDGNRKSIKKMGMKPITKEGMDYEFSIVFDLTTDHHAYAAKDRTGLFGNPNLANNLRDPRVGQQIVDWLHSGKAFVESAALADSSPTPSNERAADAGETRARAGTPGAYVFPETKRFPQMAGKRLDEIATDDLAAALPLFREHSARWADRITEVLEDRRLVDAEVKGDSAAAPTIPQPPPTPAADATAGATADAPPVAAVPTPASVAPGGAVPPAAPDGEGMTLEQALAMPLPGEPGAWGGKAGTPLGELKHDMLGSVHRWAVRTRQQDDSPLLRKLEAASALVLADVERAQVGLFPDAATTAPAADAAPPATAPAPDDPITAGVVLPEVGKPPYTMTSPGAGDLPF